MTRLYDRVLRPAYYHLIRIGRLILLPLFAAGALAFAAGELLGLPLVVQIVFWVVGLLVGLGAWTSEYLGDSA
jgi:hypothetical protein